MKSNFAILLLLATVATGCTSDPYAPVNQSTPVRQMDNAFEGRPLNAPPPGYYGNGYYGGGYAPAPRY